MKFLPRFLRCVALPFAILLLIIGSATLRPVRATSLKAQSAAERYVLEQEQEGEGAPLEDRFPPKKFPTTARELRGSFVAALLTSDVSSKSDRVAIAGAVITGDIDLRDQEILREVYIIKCTFEGRVEFDHSHFAKRFAFTWCEFKQRVSFDEATIDFDFDVQFNTFHSDAYFRKMRVGRDFLVRFSKFKSDFISFESVRVVGGFLVDRSIFNSREVYFNDMRVDGSFSARLCAFRCDECPSLKRRGDSKVDFMGTHFADVVLNGSIFDNISVVDFTGMQAGFISFDEVLSKTPITVKLQRIVFGRISPVKASQLKFLLADFDPVFYTDLETSLRTHGYTDEADNIFIAKKRAERRENCKHFLRQCSHGPWALSLFEDALAGYGKSLQNLLYWSLGFLVIGMVVFRSEKGMRTKDGKDAENYEGKYHAFWYSLDLFLPIIKLGEADVWTPKDYRRWANLYRRVHIIIGSFFVPIGLAAWTGIIR
jgi:hypothetical protein